MADAVTTYDEKDLKSLCNKLARQDPALKNIIQQYGYPPLWIRKPGFTTLLHIILEQQVSLASAKAALEKIKLKTGKLTPASLLVLTDDEMRSCFFSRQKTLYARELAKAIHSRKLKLASLKEKSDEEVRSALKQLKGIGDWTVDIYLLMALKRRDILPLGDLALIKTMREIKQLSRTASQEEYLHAAQNWVPFRSIATMLCWHYYLSKNISYRSS